MAKKPPIVSSLSMAFKKAATEISEDREEAKKSHRSNLHKLMDKFMNEVDEGKVDGIRNAKELVEVIKLDLLLLGEATERTENNNTGVDEVKIHKVEQALDMDDPQIQDLVNSVLLSLNKQNDDVDN